MPNSYPVRGPPARTLEMRQPSPCAASSCAIGAGGGGRGTGGAGMLWILRDGVPYYCESYEVERPDPWFLDLVRRACATRTAAYKGSSADALGADMRHGSPARACGRPPGGTTQHGRARRRRAAVPRRRRRQRARPQRLDRLRHGGARAILGPGQRGQPRRYVAVAVLCRMRRSLTASAVCESDRRSPRPQAGAARQRCTRARC